MPDPTPPDIATTPPPAGPITITIKPLGTIVIHGSANIVDRDGNALVIPTFKQPGVIKLCGCGRSANRPFCDGSHKIGEAGTAGTGDSGRSSSEPA